MKTIRIDIISDIVCPWCFIGYRQLERALDMAGLNGDIHWHPFELNPAMPAQGEDMADHIARKYGASAEQSAATRQQMQAIAAPLGISFAARSTRIWNSRAAHQLLHWARDSGRQTALKLALFDAYFTRGENVSDPAVLLDAVAAAGLPRALAREVLENNSFADDVAAAEARWPDMNITGVPAMIIAERGLVMGAQGEERLAAALRKMAELSPAA